MNLGIKLLVAEDDPNLGTILKAYLTQKGYTVVWAHDGEEALALYDEKDVDAIVLDVMMPVMDGFTVAEEIRRTDKKTPILFLTAKSLEGDELRGFAVGGDDFITKPFSMDSLLARVNAIMRRAFNEDRPDKNIFRIGSFVFNYLKHTLTRNGEVEKLTTKECELLRLFALNWGQVVDRSSALQKIWRNDGYFEARSMDVYITKLRKHLRPDPTIELVNVHGVGFKLTSKE